MKAQAQRVRFTVLALGVLVAALSPPARAADESSAPHKLTLTTERVIVFKDGYSLVVKRATATANEDGTVYTDQVPEAAILGSFWSTAEGTYPILATTAEWDESEEFRKQQTDCVTPLELLRANEGKRARLQLNDDRTVEGKIRAVLELEPGDTPEQQPISSIRITRSDPGAPQLPAGETVQPWIPRYGTLVVLNLGGEGDLALPVDAVRSIQIEELVTRMQRVEKVTTRSKRLSYAFGPRAAGKKLTLHLMYFTPGLRWIPTYRLAGDLGTDAELSLQGEILNELEDIEGAALGLVVGVPHFRFKETISPLALEQTLRNALQQAAPGLMQQAMSNTLFTQRASEYRGAGAGAAGSDSLALPPGLEGSGSADLFVYDLPSFSLRKGARAAVSVWRDRIELKHLYTLDVDLVRDAGDGSTVARSSRGPQSGTLSPLELADYQVWHQLELTNKSQVPWTTGPALMLRDGLPLGQDLLTYTPIGGKTLLPVTVAVDVRADVEETETQRTPNALKINNTYVTRIEKRGTIIVKNYKKESVQSRVKLAIGGRIEEVDAGGKITLNDFRSDDWQQRYVSVNNHSDAEWTFKLDPGEEKILTYLVWYYAY